MKPWLSLIFVLLPALPCTIKGVGEEGKAFAENLFRLSSDWLQMALRRSADEGLDMNETMARTIPAEFAALPLSASEYRRSVGHLFPGIEQEILEPAR